MGQVVFKINASIDGFVAKPDGDTKWIFEHFSADGGAWTLELVSSAAVHVMGRNLYGVMESYWPTTSTDPIAAPMNAIPKVVFSTTLAEATWGPARIERGPLAPAIAALKAETDGPILVHGGAGLARSLSREGLIDVYHLILHPVAIGAGLPIFDTQVNLRLAEARPFSSGATLLTYEPAGSAGTD
jgi:dihydrofolate reductase